MKVKDLIKQLQELDQEAYFISSRQEEYEPITEHYLPTKIEECFCHEIPDNDYGIFYGGIDCIKSDYSQIKVYKFE